VSPAQQGGPRNPGVRADISDLALIPVDVGEEAIQIAKVRHGSLYGRRISSDLLYRRSQLRITASRDEDVRTFVHKLLGRRKTDPAIAASNECNLSFKLTHTCVSLVVLASRSVPLSPTFDTRCRLFCAEVAGRVGRARG